MNGHTHPYADDLARAGHTLVQWLHGDALPLWWKSGADHAKGGYHELLGLDGRPVAAPRRARVQARQAFVYARAGRLGWDGPAREAAEHGLSYFEPHYRRPDGLFRAMVDADGKPLDERAFLYDQAFALLAMAELFALTGEKQLQEKAEALRGAIGASMRHEHGGFRESGDAPFQSNPHMHLLEAALAWAEAGGGDAFEALADQIVVLALSRFIDGRGGYLREFFAADWAPAEGDAGRIVEPGHQFEWAWLLERWSRRRKAPTAHRAAEELFEAGLKGIDPARAVAVDAMDDSLAVRTPRARLWPQTEWLKAAMLLRQSAREEKRSFYETQALTAARALSRYLDTPVKGLWRDKLEPSGAFVEEPAPASSLYHVICAVEALQN